MTLRECYMRAVLAPLYPEGTIVMVAVPIDGSRDMWAWSRLAARAATPHLANQSAAPQLVDAPFGWG